MKIVEYTLPSYWASYLINGDHSGLEDQDKEKCDLFINSMLDVYPKFWCLGCSEESYFSRTNDSGTEKLACDVLEYFFDIGN